MHANLMVVIVVTKLQSSGIFIYECECTTTTATTTTTTAAPTTTTEETCPDGWVDGRKIGEHGGCYLFANDGQGVNWNEAKEFCEANGGYLADIMDQETQDFIAKTSGNFPEATWWMVEMTLIRPENSCGYPESQLNIPLGMSTQESQVGMAIASTCQTSPPLVY